VIIVCTKAAVSALSVLRQMYPTKLKCEVVEADDGMGTAEALLCLRKEITGPFILLGGDALVDETCFHRMVDLHRLREAALTVLVRRPPKPTVTKKGAKPAVGICSRPQLCVYCVRERMHVCVNVCECECMYACVCVCGCGL
jgi:hypothetical protein